MSHSSSNTCSVTRRALMGAGAGAFSLSLLGQQTGAQNRQPRSMRLQDAPAAENQVVRYAEAIQSRSYDPANALESSSLHVVRAAYEGLLRHVTGTTEIEPLLASDWSVSDDATVFTFTLRPDIKFHDGTVMDATAVKKSYDRVLEMNLGPAGLLRGVSEIVAVDEETVEIHLSAPNAYFPTFVTKIGIVSPTAWEGNDQDGDFGAAWLENNTAGTGPYQLVEVRRNEQTTMERFEDYWRGWEGPHVERIEFPIVPESITRRQMLENGEVHFVGRLTPEDIRHLQDAPGVRVDVSENFEIDIMTLNVTKAPLDDIRVRQALQYAFDYDAYLNGVLLGNGRIPTGPIAEGYPTFDETLPPFEQNLERARELIEETGLTDIVLEANYYDVMAEQLQASLILQDALAKIGITLELTPMPWSTMFAVAGNPDEAMHISNLFMSTFTSDPAFTLNQNYGCEFVGQPYNWSYYCNIEAQNLIDEASATIDTDESTRLLQEAQRIILEDAPAILYSNPAAVEAYSDKVQNYLWNPVDYYWQVDWYDIYLSE